MKAADSVSFVRQQIDDFLSRGPWAVVGASTNRGKYGNKVLRCYLQHGLEVFAVNPRVTEVEGQPSYPDLKALPVRVRGASVITQPHVTERIVEDAAAAGVTHLWMQPGAESAAALARAEELDLTVIAGGPCILVALGFRDE